MTSGRTNPLSGIAMASNTQSAEAYLFTLAVKANLGEQAALVVSSILAHGPLTVQQLHHYTTLPPAKVKQALVSLLQLNVVVYSAQDWSKPKAPRFYHFLEDGALKLLFAGQIIAHIEEVYASELMASIVQTVLVSGHVTLADFLDSASQDADEVKKCFNLLVESKWLVPIDSFHFQNRYDILIKIFKEQTRAYNAEKGAAKTISQSKKLAEIKEMTRAKYVSLVLDNKNFKDLRTNGEVNAHVPLTFNLNRFLQRQRDVQLTALCRQRFGEVTTRLYALALDRIERDSPDIISGEVELTKFMASIASAAPGGTVTAGLEPGELEALRESKEIADGKGSRLFNSSDILRYMKTHGSLKRFALNPEDLIGSIVDMSAAGMKRGLDGEDRAPKRVKIEDIDHVLMAESGPADGDNKFRSIINDHLKLLQMDVSIPFLEGTTDGRYFVPFTKLTKVLKEWTYQAYVRSIFGNEAVRILNCISEKRLVEEKLLASSVLMKEAAVRSLLQKLSKFQLVEIQEIPKTQDRSAMRSTFAFRHKADAAASLMLKSIVYNMAECLDRIEKIKAENRILLDKTTREDVRGKEAEMLIASELQQLQKIHEAEVRYLTRFERLSCGFSLGWL